MNSGIYLLKFQTGDTYIGQAKDFQQRWARHDKEMLAGTHTKLVQDAYKRSGCVLPGKHKLVICHPDWLDHYEALLILQEAPPLNTQSPRPLSEQSKRALVHHLETGGAEVGTIGMLERLWAACDERDRLEERVEYLERVVRGEEVRAIEQAAESHWRGRVWELEEAVDNYEEVVEKQIRELKELRAFRERVEGLGWWGRLWAAWNA